MNPITIGLGLTALGLGLTFVGLLITAKARRLQVFDSVRGRVQDLAIKYADLMDSPDEKKRRLWDGTFFNELEWLALLVRQGEVSRKLVLEHYGPTILGWYQDIFEVYASSEDKMDPQAYSELKELAHEICIHRDRARGFCLVWRKRVGPLAVRVEVSRESGRRLAGATGGPLSA